MMDLRESAYVREQANIDGLQKGDSVYISNPNMHLNHYLKPKTWVYEVSDMKGRTFEEVKHKDLVRDIEYIVKKWFKHGIDWYAKYMEGMSGEEVRIYFDETELLPPTCPRELKFEEYFDENETKMEVDESEDESEYDVPTPEGSHDFKASYYYKNKENEDIEKRKLLTLFDQVSQKVSIAKFREPNVGVVTVKYYIRVASKEPKITDFCFMWYCGTGTIIDREGKLVVTAGHCVGLCFYRV